MSGFESTSSATNSATSAAANDVEEDMSDLNAEVLECCRYGEPDDLRPLLAYGADVNFCDENKNTALHKAAANGHVNCLAILKEFGALLKRNAQGNLPIHWAVQNKQKEAFDYLLNNFECDCLEKNDFGKSTLTEAINTEDQDIITLCLNHKSTSEQNLTATASTDEASSASSSNVADEEGELSEVNAVFHDMNFDRSSSLSLRVRELPISRADNPFGGDTTPEDDTTGMGIWPASILTSRWAIHNKSMFEGKVALELGAGCGLPSVAVAKYCQPKLVYMTDINSATLKNSVANARLNGASSDTIDLESRLSAIAASQASRSPLTHEECILEEVNCENGSTLRVSYLSWLDTFTFPTEPVDVVFGSDLVYDINIVAPLTFAVSKILKDGGAFLYAAPDENRMGLDMIEVAFKEANLVLAEKIPCPERFYDNPLLGEGSADNFVLHFMDLPAKKPFSLYRFVKEAAKEE